VDDSIVRLTTQKKLVALLKKVKARQIHARIASPPYLYPCFYGIDTWRIKGELVAQRLKGDWEKIAKEAGLDSLAYLSLESTLKAVWEISPQLKPENFCIACFTGEYPI
jgi:amidophosphoribosyltransferase